VSGRPEADLSSRSLDRIHGSDTCHRLSLAFFARASASICSAMVVANHLHPPRLEDPAHATGATSDNNS